MKKIGKKFYLVGYLGANNHFHPVHYPHDDKLVVKRTFKQAASHATQMIEDDQAWADLAIVSCTVVEMKKRKKYKKEK